MCVVCICGDRDNVLMSFSAFSSILSLYLMRHLLIYTAKQLLKPVTMHPAAHVQDNQSDNRLSQLHAFVVVSNPCNLSLLC